MHLIQSALEKPHLGGHSDMLNHSNNSDRNFLDLFISKIFWKIVNMPHRITINAEKVQTVGRIFFSSNVG